MTRMGNDVKRTDCGEIASISAQRTALVRVAYV